MLCRLRGYPGSLPRRLLRSLAAIDSSAPPPHTTASLPRPRPFSSASSDGPRRRRRRPGSKSEHLTADTALPPPKSQPDPDDDAAPGESPRRLAAQSEDLFERSNEPFAPKDADGNDVTVDEYLKLASLSPWVPAPDIVVRRALEIAKAGPDDVHYDLGCGDGRFCLHALESPHGVKKAVGIDVDPTVLASAEDRLARRHPRPDNVEFVLADLMDEGERGDEIWRRIREECTVLTMYFVEEALQKLRPRLEQTFDGKKGCRIVTVGYKMKGWESSWTEGVLGLTVNLYETPEEFGVTEETMEEIGRDMADVTPQEVRALRDHDIGVSIRESTPMDEMDYEKEFDWDFDEDEELEGFADSEGGKGSQDRNS